MKTELVTSVPPSFPAVYRCPKTKLTVLFSSENAGTVLHCPSGVHAVGHHSVEWVTCFDLKEWVRLPAGELVQLSN